jgi:proteic killer suppression protein
VQIRNFVHKGLKRLYEQDDRTAIPAPSLDKLRKMLAFLDDVEDPRELRFLPIWKSHLSSGGRKGTWSLHVSRNWRLTFRIDSAAGEIFDVNLEDYH